MANALGYLGYLMRVDQFQALARLAGMRPGSSAYIGAMAHMVNNVKQCTIAAELGITPATISKAIARLRRAELDAIRATR